MGIKMLLYKPCQVSRVVFILSLSFYYFLLSCMANDGENDDII
jgi:hypothetical protein